MKSLYVGTLESKTAEKPLSTLPVAIGLNGILKCAIVLSWPDLMRPDESGLIHVEYQPEPDRSIRYVKVWLSKARGDWKLVCQCWTDIRSSQPALGLCFSNGYGSRDLAQMLEFVMKYQDTFTRPSIDCYEGLVQIYPPTEEERMAAGSSMSEAVDRIGVQPNGTLAA